MLAHFADAGDTRVIIAAAWCAAGLMTLFNLAILNAPWWNDAVDATRAGRHVRQVDPEAAPEPTTRAANQKRRRNVYQVVAVLLARLCIVALWTVRPGPLPRRARAVIAAKRLSTVDSDPSSRKED